MFALVSVQEPWFGEVQPGGQSGTRTLPLTPRLPTWICAWLAGPVRFFQVSVHLSLLPVSVAVKRPEAPALVPLGWSVSWLTVRVALNLTVFACPLPAASDTLTSAATATAATAVRVRFKTTSSFDLPVFRPLPIGLSLASRDHPLDGLTAEGGAISKGEPRGRGEGWSRAP